jgi:ABC-type sulfate/molybdate transport systems ATPase subunit
MSLILKNISLPLASFTLEVDVEIHGRVTVIFGPSGSGKTSLLEVVAGLRAARSAFIQLDDRVLTDVARGVFVPIRQRGIGYVPQDLALFPHLSVRQNLLYGRKSGGTRSAFFPSSASLRFWKSNRSCNAASRSFRAAKNSASPWRALCSPRRACSCWTNRWPAWT